MAAECEVTEEGYALCDMGVPTVVKIVEYFWLAWNMWVILDNLPLLHWVEYAQSAL
jgi:hypothetical protein